MLIAARGPLYATFLVKVVRQAIAWSHDLLNEEERDAFRNLAVFAGGFDLAAAEQVGTSLDAAGAPRLDTAA